MYITSASLWLAKNVLIIFLNIRYLLYRHASGLYSFSLLSFHDSRPFIKVSNVLIYITFTKVQHFENNQ